MSVEVKQILHDVAQQAYSIAMGLQNVAPPTITGQEGIKKSSQSVQYLFDIAFKLEEISRYVEKNSPNTASYKKK